MKKLDILNIATAAAIIFSASSVFAVDNDEKAEEKETEVHEEHEEQGDNTMTEKSKHKNK